MENRRKLPAGIQDFEKLRTGGNSNIVLQ